MILRPSFRDLDRALLSAESGDIVELGEGIYRTKGNWGFPRFISVPDGVAITGRGRSRTIIRLDREAVRVADGIQRPDRDLNVLWCGVGCEISDLTIDGAEEDFRESTNAPAWYIGGVRFHGRFELCRCRVMGLRGSWMAKDTLNSQIEVFAVSSRGNTGGSFIEDVGVDAVAGESYVSGIYLGSDEASEPSFVSRCRVDLGLGNQFGFSANRGVTFRDSSCSGGKYGFYNDTGPTVGVRVQNCLLAGSYAAASLVAKDPSGARSVVFADSVLRGQRGLEVWDRTGLKVPADVRIDGCIVDADYSTAIDNEGPCLVKVTGSTLKVGSREYLRTGCPLPQYDANRLGDGRAAVDNHQAQI